VSNGPTEAVNKSRLGSLSIRRFEGERQVEHGELVASPTHSESRLRLVFLLEQCAR
jgi:hypothetical protein